MRYEKKIRRLGIILLLILLTGCGNNGKGTVTGTYFVGGILGYGTWAYGKYKEELLSKECYPCGVDKEK